ncbi:hypothetical protein OSX66_09885 [Staphylococcus agnetis]|uniref:hypothetical protein n=1 Tax=Staphylococcus agnetis TaxID=985762 RepID=UPI00241879B3|nr:hypothetical protein [Staphylococcus agnetis]MDG4944207.1 hypothetical protein [Staphylococcus agnetis]
MDKQEIEQRLIDLSKEIGLKNVILIGLDLVIKEDITLCSDELKRLMKARRQIEKI